MTYRVSEAAVLLGVSDDTVRRWVESARIPAGRDQYGRFTIDGVALAEFAQTLQRPAETGQLESMSAPNRLRGIITRLTLDGLVAEVELQVGPFRMVSMLSREVADELRLEVGAVAIAAINATDVGLAIPARRSR